MGTELACANTEVPACIKMLDLVNSLVSLAMRNCCIMFFIELMGFLFDSILVINLLPIVSIFSVFAKKVLVY